MDSDSSEDEELALFALVCGGRPRLKRFNFDQLATAPMWKSKIRYAKDDIQALIVHFRLPDPFPTRQRYHVSAFEALCIFLRRMAYPARLDDLKNLVGREPEVISSILNSVLDYLHHTFSHLLLFGSDRLTEDTLQAYSRAVFVKGAPLHLLPRHLGFTMPC